MSMAVGTLLTEEEFLNLPEFEGRQELIDGELVELPPAKHSHNQRLRWHRRFLESALGEERVFSEEGFRLAPRRWLIPDLSVTWPQQRIENDYFQGAPMVAIEIASRGNTPEILERKILLYLEYGAAEVWVDYPATRTMMIRRRDGAQHVAADADYVCELLGITIAAADRAADEDK